MIDHRNISDKEDKRKRKQSEDSDESISLKSSSEEYVDDMDSQSENFEQINNDEYYSFSPKSGKHRLSSKIYNVAKEMQKEKYYRSLLQN